MNTSSAAGARADNAQMLTQPMSSDSQSSSEAAEVLPQIYPSCSFAAAAAERDSSHCMINALNDMLFAFVLAGLFDNEFPRLSQVSMCFYIRLHDSLENLQVDFFNWDDWAVELRRRRQSLMEERASSETDSNDSSWERFVMYSGVDNSFAEFSFSSPESLDPEDMRLLH